MLYSWITSSLMKEGLPPTREGLSSWIEKKIRNTLHYAIERSLFYNERLKKYKNILNCPKSEFLMRFSRLPYTTAEDIVRRHYEFLCAPLSEVQRGYSVETVSGELKRVFFSKDELLHVIEAISHVIEEFNVDKGEKIAILFPREHEWGIPDLIAKAVAKTGAIASQVDSPQLDQQYHKLATMNPYLVIGSAQQIFYLSLHILRKKYDKIPTKAIIASHGCFPYILSGKARETIARAWGVEPLEHFGLTEAGFNVALECYSHRGLHINEVDVYAETVDPRSGELLPPEEIGELVITSLNRRTMPIIRYRTNYLVKIEEAPCSCKDKLTRRLKIYSSLSEGITLSIFPYFVDFS